MEGRQYTDLRWIACKSRRFQVITDDGLAPNLRDPVVRDFFRDIIFLNCHEIGLIPHQVGTVRIMSVLKEMFSRYLDCPITTEFMKRYEAEINAQNRGPSTSNQEQDSNEILSGESRANYLNKLSNWISTRSELNVGQMSWDTAALLNGDNLSENSMPADCHEEKTTDQGLGKWLSDTGTAAATAVNDTLKNNTWRNEMIEIIRPVSNAIGAAWLWLNEDV
ncbi:hypothetical protein GNI_045640 [Gregarina niphandrodes]|uniref:Uncharacterized protein n=1 Tax=Gregarina niphandrodes TaxID=110365 RepID=A0A023B9S7_GRENI|nr:hypothetical protein GNI_045640 [Gregarina niphandrodes]EZG76054.1 hypothetical protein GNI_045640 [Gregarina niphandrodes]|eukprot:XP_011129588.1 hypothetical protein GNI_045640 [Gregarina niphandrodes]